MGTTRSLRLSWTLVLPLDSGFSLCVDFGFQILIVNGFLGLNSRLQSPGFRIPPAETISCSRWHHQCPKKKTTGARDCLPLWVWVIFLRPLYVLRPSVDQSSRFTGVPNLGKPLYREKTVYIKTHKTAINPGPWITQERRNTHYK